MRVLHPRVRRGDRRRAGAGAAGLPGARQGAALIAFRVGTNFSSNEVGGLPFTTSYSGMVSSFINAGQVVTSTSNTISATVGNGVTNIRLHNNQNTGDSHNPNTTAEYYRLNFTYKTS